MNTDCKNLKILELVPPLWITKVSKSNWLRTLCKLIKFNNSTHHKTTIAKPTETAYLACFCFSVNLLFLAVYFFLNRKQNTDIYHKNIDSYCLQASTNCHCWSLVPKILTSYWTKISILIYTSGTSRYQFVRYIKVKKK